MVLAPTLEKLSKALGPSSQKTRLGPNEPPLIPVRPPALWAEWGAGGFSPGEAGESQRELLLSPDLPLSRTLGGALASVPSPYGGGARGWRGTDNHQGTSGPWGPAGQGEQPGPEAVAGDRALFLGAAGAPEPGPS